MFFFVLGVLVSVLIYYKLIRPCSYWKDRGVKHARSWPLVGSMGAVVLKRRPFATVSLDLYNKYPEERYVGYMQFTQNFLLIRDLDLIKKITTQDFNHFQSHVRFGQSDSDPLLSKNLLFMSGEEWKSLRSSLSPAFTSSKMRNMYLMVEECAENFVNHYQADVEVEMRDVFSRFTTDVIASTAFGITVDSFKEPNNEFFAMGVILTKLTAWQTVKIIMTQMSKSVGNLFGIQVFPKRATEFFKRIVKDNIEKREAEGIVRPDLIHLLMEARKGKLKPESGGDNREGFAAVEESQIEPSSKEVELSDEHILAQAMLFFFAAFDTVSTAASFMAYELALNPDIQKKLQEEIDSVKSKHDGKIPYDALLSMKYLDQVVSETLRKWPPNFETDRLCVKDYLIPSTNPDEKGFLVKKGIVALVPMMALQRDPQYYPEPDRFDPERFNDENKSKVVPGTYLPFGMGPRNCIGSRFALLEIKSVFCHLLGKFDITPYDKTEIPMKLSSKHFNMQPEKGFWLRLNLRKEGSS
jgi:cytochrome P450 family 9